MYTTSQDVRKQNIYLCFFEFFLHHQKLFYFSLRNTVVSVPAAGYKNLGSPKILTVPPPPHTGPAPQERITLFMEWAVILA